MQFMLSWDKIGRLLIQQLPTWQDLDVLQSVLKATEGFKDLTDLLSGEKRITCSAIKPLIRVINDKIVIPQDGDSKLTLKIKGCIKADLASHYENSEINQLLNVCSFLDLQFKDKFTSEHLTVLNLMTYWVQDHQRRRANSVPFLEAFYHIVHKVHLVYQRKLNVRQKCTYNILLQISMNHHWIGGNLECKRMPPLFSSSTQVSLCMRNKCSIREGIQHWWAFSQQTLQFLKTREG